MNVHQLIDDISSIVKVCYLKKFVAYILHTYYATVHNVPYKHRYFFILEYYYAYHSFECST